MSESELNTLYHLARSGEAGAESLLLDRLRERFRRFVRGRVAQEADADDIVQDALVSVCKEYKSVELTSGFTDWAFTILRNKQRDHWRKEQRRSLFTERYRAALGEQWYRDLKVDGMDRLLHGLREVAKTNARYARVLLLYGRGYTVDEICERMQIRRNNFYVLLSRARATLRQCIDKADNNGRR